MIETVSAVMEVPRTLLNKSEMEFDAASNILTQIDKIGKNNPESPTEIFAVQSKNIALRSFVNVNSSDITVFTPHDLPNNQSNETISSVAVIHTVKGILDHSTLPNQSAVMFLPSDIFEDGTEHVSAVVFINDNLFVSGRQKFQSSFTVASRVLSVTIGKRSIPKLRKNVTLMFKKPPRYQQNGSFHCSFWKKGRDA